MTNGIITDVCSLGIDIGGTSIKAAVVDASGAARFSSNLHTPSVGRSLFEEGLTAFVNKTMLDAGQQGVSISSIGIGVPGLVSANRIVGAINNLPFLQDVCLSEPLMDEFDCPIYVDNDAFFMALAESRFGAAIGARDTLFLTVGTGIGSALMLNGKFYRGAQGRGAEVGHMLIQDCEDGSYVTLQSLASTSALVSKFRALADDGYANGHSLVSAYLEGQSAAKTAMDWHFNHLAAGISSLINIFNPNLVVLGGGIVEAGDFYIEEINKRVLSMALEEAVRDVRLVGAQQGNLAGCIGAAYYASLTEPA